MSFWICEGFGPVAVPPVAVPVEVVFAVVGVLLPRDAEPPVLLPAPARARVEVVFAAVGVVVVAVGAVGVVAGMV